MSYLGLVAQALYFSFCIFVLFLFVRTVRMGPAYISALNFDWSNRALQVAFENDRIGLFIFRASGYSMAGIVILAMASTLYCLLFSLGDWSFQDRDGEWMTYRFWMATSFGVPLGLFCFDGVVKLCQRVPLSAELSSDDIVPGDQLRRILGKEIS